MTDPGSLHRLSAFTDDPEAGNPAGVWIGERLPVSETMQRIARDIGYSETAFLAPERGFERTVRYFSPKAEVPFCGHATIATGVALGSMEGEGTYRLTTSVGEIPVRVRSRNGDFHASLTSVTPRYEVAPQALVVDTLDALGWHAQDLDPSLPPARAFAGAWHLVLAAMNAARLAQLDYDFDGLESIMRRDGLTTLQLVWREGATLFHARNPFPVGGVVEDPATGAAAAALGGYLRDASLITAPTTILIRQGETMGRPSRLEVSIPERGGIVVSGTAVWIR